MAAYEVRAFGAVGLLMVMTSIACTGSGNIRRLDDEPIRAVEVDRVVSELMDEAGVTGLCLAILNDNEPAYVKAYGFRDKGRNEPLTTDSVMLGASFSKALFAYVVMQLVLVWQDRFSDDFAVGRDITEAPLEPLRWTRASAGGSLLTTVKDYARFVAAVMRREGLDEDAWHTMLSPAIRIDSPRQFPTLGAGTTDTFDAIELSYGLGWGLFTCGHGAAFFKEGHGSGCQNYNVNFIDRQASIIIMTNSDNGEKVFKNLLERTIGDTCTPWEWEGYIPYSDVKPTPIGVYMYDIIHMHDVDKAIAAYRRIAASPARNSFLFDEDQLNGLGYQMLREDRLAGAVELFEMNVEEYPESANTHDSLGEVYSLDGQTERAIASYERSLQLNPGNSNAAEMLAKLKGGR